MTEIQARKLVNSLAPLVDGWLKGTPESLVKLALKLSVLGVTEKDIRDILQEIIDDLSAEYGELR